MNWRNVYDKQLKIWHGNVEKFDFDKNRSIGDIIYERQSNDPYHICQISDTDGKSLTNKESLTASIRIALQLQKLGLNHTHYVGICARNSSFVYSLAIGCYFNATPFHAVNANQDNETIAHVYGMTKPKIIFCDGQDYEKIVSATHSFKPIIYTLTEHRENVPKLCDLLQPVEREVDYRPVQLIEGGDQTMAVLCSSGTTGLPKAVFLSNRALVFERYHDLCQTDDVIFSLSGLDWLTGMLTCNACAMYNCTRIITSKPFTATYFVELIKKYKISYCFTAPRYLAALVDCNLATPKNLSSVRLLVVAGSACSLMLLKEAQALFVNAAVTFGYGTTEAGGIATNYNLKGGTAVGNFCPGYAGCIINEKGIRLGPNEIGELLVHNGRKWKGYFNNSKETQAMQDAQGWFHSGDVGYFDENCFLHIVDRKKEIRKYAGMHYWPAEIETVIAELPDVLNVSVISIYDVSKGDAAGAVVVKKAHSQLTEDDVKEYVAKRLAATYKHLHAGVLFVQQMPMNPNGKIIKKEVQSLLLAGKAGIVKNN